MGMEFTRYINFECFALNSVSKLLNNELEKSYSFYNSELTALHRKVIGERRNQKLHYATDRDSLNQYVNDFYEKINGLKNSLFHEANGTITYLLDDVKIDDSEDTTMRCIRILKELVFQLYETAKRDYDSVFISLETSVPPTQRRKNRRLRSPNRGSFFLLNPNVNFNAIHSRLTQKGHCFIDPEATSAEDIRAVFSGKNISNKVVWYEANSLRYFIRKLNENNLIEHPNEGIWKRTVACFKPSEGEFEPNDLKDTKDPIASVTLLLDEVLKLFSI